MSREEVWTFLALKDGVLWRHPRWSRFTAFSWSSSTTNSFDLLHHIVDTFLNAVSADSWIEILPASWSSRGSCSTFWLEPCSFTGLNSMGHNLQRWKLAQFELWIPVNVDRFKGLARWASLNESIFCCARSNTFHMFNKINLLYCVCSIDERL